MMLERMRPAALGRGRRAGEIVSVRTPITSKSRLRPTPRQALATRLKVATTRGDRSEPSFFLALLFDWREA
jgi:hypothetical protein